MVNVQSVFFLHEQVVFSALGQVVVFKFSVRLFTSHVNLWERRGGVASPGSVKHVPAML